MVCEGSESVDYTRYIGDLSEVSVIIDDDGNGTNAITHYADKSGNVSDVIVKKEFYVYSEEPVRISVNYNVDIEKLINEANHYRSIGSGDTFSMWVGSNQDNALLNEKNIAIGDGNLVNANARKCMTVGIENMGSVTGEHNTSMGYHSLFRITSGKRNVAFGNETQDDLTTGDNNTGVGAYALQRNSLGSGNTAIGYGAVQGGSSYPSYNPNAKFEYNTGVGFQSLYGIENGICNVAIGADSSKNQKTGSYNVAIGTGSLKTNDSGSRNIAIGNNADVSIADLSNVIVIGVDEQATENNQIKIGKSTHTSVIIAGKKINFNADGTVTWEAIN